MILHIKKKILKNGKFTNFDFFPMELLNFDR